MSFRFNFLRLLPVVVALFLQGSVLTAPIDELPQGTLVAIKSLQNGKYLEVVGTGLQAIGTHSATAKNSFRILRDGYFIGFESAAANGNRLQSPPAGQGGAFSVGFNNGNFQAWEKWTLEGNSLGEAWLKSNGSTGYLSVRVEKPNAPVETKDHTGGPAGKGPFERLAIEKIISPKIQDIPTNAAISSLKTNAAALQLAPDVSGGAMSIAVGGQNGDVVWAVSNEAWTPGPGAKAIYKLVNNAWQKMEGGAAFDKVIGGAQAGQSIIDGGQISVGKDGSVWVIGGLDANRGFIYHWDNAINNWSDKINGRQITGRLNQISVYDENLICGIGQEGSNMIYITTDKCANWRRLDGVSAKWSSVTKDAQGNPVVWAVSQDRKLYRRANATSKYRKSYGGANDTGWKQSPNASGDKVLAVDAATLLVVNSTTDGSCWLSTSTQSDGLISAWEPFMSPGFKFNQISATSNGKIWAVSKADGKVYSNSGILAPVATPVASVTPHVFNFEELAKFGFVDGAEVAFKTNTGKYLKLEHGDLKVGDDVLPIGVLKATADQALPGDTNCWFKVQKRGDYVGFKNAAGLNLVFGYRTAYFVKTDEQSPYASFMIEGDTQAATDLSNVYIKSVLDKGAWFLGKGTNPDERFQNAANGRGDPTAKFMIQTSTPAKRQDDLMVTRVEDRPTPQPEINIPKPEGFRAPPQSERIIYKEPSQPSSISNDLEALLKQLQSGTVATVTPPPATINPAASQLPASMISGTTVPTPVTPTTTPPSVTTATAVAAPVVTTAAPSASAAAPAVTAPQTTVVNTPAAIAPQPPLTIVPAAIAPVVVQTPAKVTTTPAVSKPGVRGRTTRSQAKPIPTKPAATTVIQPTSNSVTPTNVAKSGGAKAAIRASRSKKTNK